MIKGVINVETNRIRLERLGMVDKETIIEVSQEKRCVLCDQFIEKNLTPTNPVCEGRWCDEAIEYWLDAYAEELDV